MARELVILLLAMSSTTGHSLFSEIIIDQHPCKPEILKNAFRYMCDPRGRVICMEGWKDPEKRSTLTDLNPCLEPICDFNGEGCVNGECRAPNNCACEVGWDGESCDICLPLPGCVNGYCDKAYECICHDGWKGAFCDVANCDGCLNGVCISPTECRCHNGWSGPGCDVCQTLPGCLHGSCDAFPNTCVCDEHWEGPLCDKPKCSQNCDHGVCQYIQATDSTQCICESGWQGEACDQCVPYWECPNQENACNLPNECLCANNTQDDKGLCGNHLLTNLRGHVGHGGQGGHQAEGEVISGFFDEEDFGHGKFGNHFGGNNRFQGHGRPNLNLGGHGNHFGGSHNGGHAADPIANPPNTDGFELVDLEVHK